MSPTPTPPATRTSRRTSRAWSIRSPTATRISAASPRAQVSLNALQGNVISTSTATDLAVQGAGFFVVSDSSGTLYLTRNGSFTPDASGNLVNSAGYYLMAANVQNGASPLAANSLTGLQKVNVVNAGQTATATTTASLTANLPSTATPVAPANLPSTNSAGSTYTDATSLVVYDNLGGSHTINLYFTNTGSNTWEVDAYDASKASANAGFPYSSGPLATQTLTFNPTTGALSSGSPLSIHGAERPDDEPRSEQHDAACGGLQRDRGDRERKCAERHQRRLHLDQWILDIQLCERDVERRLRHSARQCGEPRQSRLGQRRRLFADVRFRPRLIWEPRAARASARSKPRRSKARRSTWRRS